MRERGGNTNSGSPWLKRTLLWGGAAVVVALIGWGMVRLAGTVPTATGDGNLSVAVNDRDNILGPASASVTLVEYSDFQCPACAAYNSVLKQVFSDPKYKDKVRLVYRYFPLTNIHRNAELSARAGQAAALQGKFWEMHDKLFEAQTTWAELSDTAARDLFKGYATQLGMDVGKFTSDLDSSAVKDVVTQQSDSGVRSGVDSTPTFFVNGKLMPRVSSYEEFGQRLLDATHANP